LHSFPIGLAFEGQKEWNAMNSKGLIKRYMASIKGNKY
jgi:hypothetical protein